MALFFSTSFLMLAAVLILLAAIAIFDFRTRRIPNELVLGLMALALLRMVEVKTMAAAFTDVKWAGVVLLVTFVFWTRKWLGGGDVKMLFAASLLVGTSVLPHFLLFTTFAGGVIGLFAIGDMWLERRIGWSSGLAFPRGTLRVRAAGTPVPNKASVPYGVAISVGCLLALLSTSTWMR